MTVYLLTYHDLDPWTMFVCADKGTAAWMKLLAIQWDYEWSKFLQSLPREEIRAGYGKGLSGCKYLWGWYEVFDPNHMNIEEEEVIRLP